jgi:hypothetical protein
MLEAVCWCRKKLLRRRSSAPEYKYTVLILIPSVLELSGIECTSTDSFFTMHFSEEWICFRRLALKLFFTTNSKWNASKFRQFLMAVCEEDITATGNHAAGQLYCIIDTVHVTGHSPGHAT